MSTTIIKRLSQNGTEFVPITLSEAVVVNPAGFPGFASDASITTLDKVLQEILRFVGINVTSIDQLETVVVNINEELANKQNKLTPGTGISISEEGVISTTMSATIYTIVPSLSDVSTPQNNTIYLVPNTEVEEQNQFLEYIWANGAWELVGTISSTVDLTDYVTKVEFNTFKNLAITATTVTTSNGSDVFVDYTIPDGLYDTLVDEG